MLEAALTALTMIADPFRLGVLAAGVVLGLVIGILPGIGGLAGTALLLPFTFSMDPYTAFAFLLGLGAVTATGDPIPAILFGVPGGAGSAATVLDGLPLARRGEAGRALSAAYSASLFGGLFGALMLAVSIPVFRPMMRFVQSPELLAFTVFGLSMVAVMAGKSPLRGLVAACIGLMLSMFGADPKTGTMRWTFDTLYLFEGLPLLPVVLGLFAVPELCDLAITRESISTKTKYNVRRGMVLGFADTVRNWWLVIRCGSIGGVLAAIPGIGGAIIDWIAYAHARATCRGAAETFGKGDIRGVIASESANNAKEGGALIPTIAFGVPGTATMALLLSAFLVHGLQPGPDMLGPNLSFTYGMIWSVAIANILGAGLCYAFSGQFAKLATLRYTLILPTVLSIIFIGAFEGSRSWGDVYTMLIFGVIGWTMKQLQWARPPLLLGFVLGDMFERYLFISIDRYGMDWMMRPLVIALFALAFFAFARAFWQDYRAHGGIRAIKAGLGKPNWEWSQLYSVLVLGAVAILLILASPWDFQAGLVPRITGGIALSLGALSLAGHIFYRPVGAGSAKMYYELVAQSGHLSGTTILLRAGVFFGWLLSFLVSMATAGIFVTIPLFVATYMRLEGKERWPLVIANALCLTLFVYFVFDRILHIPWPHTLLRDLLPQARVIPGV
ncbi:tripartite tricarboxylate transporter permease [Chelativorans xinjiangense]|uniref:tripartite tricarboxylate transporter permease n=1 Tax=Chelativorans xinjiangense TaxID=2681485 RepID=UPI00135BD58C|nr:tripartite tricarboxylate transporter permease [Chelativorans xinjiangense]